MTDFSNPAWWASISSAVGALAAVLFGDVIGKTAEVVVVSVGGIVVAVYVASHHQLKIAETKSAAFYSGLQHVPQVAADTAARTLAAMTPVVPVVEMPPPPMPIFTQPAPE